MNYFNSFYPSVYGININMEVQPSETYNSGKKFANHKLIKKMVTTSEIFKKNWKDISEKFIGPLHDTYIRNAWIFT